MMEDNATDRENQESTGHAQWLRDYAQLTDAGFAEYPDELSRRGSSSGPVPGANPWLADDSDDKPAKAAWEADTEPAPPAPVLRLDEPTHQPAIVSARTDADERIGQDIGDVLAASKRLEGKHLLVEVVDGEVFLHGTVADEALRSEVEQLTSSVRGVGRIYNELDVRS